MSTYIGLYGNSPTEGLTDGTSISEDMTQTSPLSVTLNATESEAVAMKVALRCEAGYKTSGNTEVCFKYWDGSAYQDTGGNISKWKVAPDNGFTAETALSQATWADTLTITDVIGSTNHCFWVKAEAGADEKPKTDRTVSIHVSGIVEADEE